VQKAVKSGLVNDSHSSRPLVRDGGVGSKVSEQRAKTLYATKWMEWANGMTKEATS